MPALFRRFSFALAASVFFLSSPAHAQQAPAGTTPTPVPKPAPKATTSGLTSTGEQAVKLITDAAKKMNANDIDGALNSLNQAIQLNPNTTGAFVLRASIYCQKKQWPQAEADFKAAAAIAPTNVALKFNVVEVKFMEGQYDAARVGFAELQNDPAVIKKQPEMADFAAYKVFLCDVFGGHHAQAKKELEVFNDTMGNPSYYFGNAAWDLVVKKDPNDAREWLLSASRIYPPEKNSFYAQSLRTLGYLPIPGPNDVVNPPGATKPAAAAK
jgi:tetratricopeptide (TPR) repeat protein